MRPFARLTDWLTRITNTCCGLHEIHVLLRSLSCLPSSYAPTGHTENHIELRVLACASKCLRSRAAEVEAFRKGADQYGYGVLFCEAEPLKFDVVKIRSCG